VSGERDPSVGPAAGDSLRSGPSSAPDGVIEAGFERVRHVANTLRLRNAFVVASLVWPAFLGADFAIARWVAPGPAEPFVLLRLALWALILAAAFRLTRPTLPSPRVVRLIETGLACLTTAAIGAMAAFADGVTWPFCAGAMLVIMARSACIAEPWPSGMRANVAITASFTVAMVLGLAFGPRGAHDLGSPQVRGTLALGLMHVVGAAVFSVVASHVSNQLRRDVYEARRVGRYRLERLLGVGGMGEVWSAFHAELRRQVALKVLKAASGHDPKAVERFTREVEATSRLRHPNTIRIFDFGVTDDGVWYYAMELLEGSNLHDRVAAEGPLAPSHAVWVTLQAALALAEAHAHGITHRDIKPENIFLTLDAKRQELVKVLDFGIAQVTRDAASEQLTRTGAIIGSPHYLSPEAARGAPVDARSDVYSLGAVLFYALTGRAPFDAPHLMALLVAHMQAPAPRLDGLLGEPAPVALQAILDRAMAKEPETRFADGAAFAEALARYLGEHPHAPGQRAGESAVRRREGASTPTPSSGEVTA